jgi:tail tube protein
MPVVSMGTIFKKGTTAIAEIKSIDGISVSSETIESTALDNANGYRSFVTSLKDGGEVTLSCNFNFTSHNPLLLEFENGTTSTYTIEFPDRLTTSGSKWTFSAVITAFSTSVELEDLVGAEITLKVSGKPTLSAPV